HRCLRAAGVLNPDPRPQDSGDFARARANCPITTTPSIDCLIGCGNIPWAGRCVELAKHLIGHAANLVTTCHSMEGRRRPSGFLKRSVTPTQQLIYSLALCFRKKKSSSWTGIQVLQLLTVGLADAPLVSTILKYSESPARRSDSSVATQLRRDP